MAKNLDVTRGPFGTIAERSSSIHTGRFMGGNLNEAKRQAASEGYDTITMWEGNQRPRGRTIQLTKQGKPVPPEALADKLEATPCAICGRSYPQPRYTKNGQPVHATCKVKKGEGNATDLLRR